MTPQAVLRARFAEAAEAAGVQTRFRRRGDKFYLDVALADPNDNWTAANRFVRDNLPTAWMTSGGAWEWVYGLPVADVERILEAVRVDPAWLDYHGGAAVGIARAIREGGAFDRLPILADALEEGGCDRRAILDHLRAGERHRGTCWVVELLLGPDRRRPRG